MPHLSKQRANKILSNTSEWMEGKITIYEVAKRSNCNWHTANKWLPIYAEMIKNKETEIVNKLTKIDETEDTGRKSTIWQKLKKRIWSRILTAQSAIQTPK